MKLPGLAGTGGGVARFFCVTIPRFLLGVLIFVGIAINFANIVGRYVFSKPIIWAEEILVYIMIWCVCVGAILVTWEGRHIKMDLLSTKFAPPWRQIINSLVALGFALVCIFVIRHSWTVVTLMFSTDQQSVIARLPMGLMHVSILVAFSAMLVVLLLRLRLIVSGALGSDAQATTEQLVEIYGGFDDKQGTARNG